MHSIVRVPRCELVPYLLGDPVGNVQSLYLCEGAPDAAAEVLHAESGRGLAGFLLREGPTLPGANRGAARLHLLSPRAGPPLALVWWEGLQGADGPAYLTLPLWAEGLVRGALPTDPAHLLWSVDAQTACTAADFRAPRSAHEVILAHRGNAADLHLPGGWDRDLPDPDGHGLCACVRMEGRVVARACSYVQTAEVGYVQKVETLPDHRRRGCAAAAVAAVTTELFSRGKVAAYHHDEANAASGATCRTLGFRVHRRVAVAAWRPG